MIDFFARLIGDDACDHRRANHLVPDVPGDAEEVICVLSADGLREVQRDIGDTRGNRERFQGTQRAEVLELPTEAPAGGDDTSVPKTDLIAWGNTGLGTRLLASRGSKCCAAASAIAGPSRD